MIPVVYVRFVLPPAAWRLRRGLALAAAARLLDRCRPGAFVYRGVVVGRFGVVIAR